VDHEYSPELSLDLAAIAPLELDASQTATLAQMAPVIEGKPDVTKIQEIDLQKLGQTHRLQRITFETVRDIYGKMNHSWKGNTEFLLSQLLRIVERFLVDGRINITPPVFDRDDDRRRIILTLNMNKIVQHIWEAIRFNNTLKLSPVFDTERPIRSTGDMQTWFTGKPCEYTKRSHISHCVFDSTWEASEAFKLDRDPNVEAWVKNDHLGFDIVYIFNGLIHKYRPDFLIRLKNGKTLVLEVKGQDSPENQTKRRFFVSAVL
jgi:type III restriction enzyme